MPALYGANSSPYFTAATAREAMTNKCGERMCSPLQYCSVLDLKCLECDDICRHSSHNYQPQNCEKLCYDTGADYTTKMLAAIQRTQQDVRSLKLQVNTLLVVSSVCVLLGLTYWLGTRWCQCRSARRSNAKKKKDSLMLTGFDSHRKQDISVFTVPTAHNSLPEFAFGRHNPSFTMAYASTRSANHSVTLRVPSEDVCDTQVTDAYENSTHVDTPPLSSEESRDSTANGDTDAAGTTSNRQLQQDDSSS